MNAATNTMIEWMREYVGGLVFVGEVGEFVEIIKVKIEKNKLYQSMMASIGLQKPRITPRTVHRTSSHPSCR